MRNTIYSIGLGLFLAAASANVAKAQDYINTPVEISKEKVKIDGKICYSHIVLEKQTLYSISKAYGVSIVDIYKFNPSIKESGLKKNSIIIIPSQEALDIPVKAEYQNPKTTETPVQAKEIKPAEEQKPTGHKDLKEKKPVRFHIAKWYEDLDVIADQYNVSVEDIMKANNLKGRKLSKRQKLIIPYPGEDPVAKPQETDEGNAVTESETEPVQSTEATTDSVVAIVPKSKVNAAILLPLTTADGEPNRNNMDFYCGALLAVYDMAAKGIDCNLNVYDIVNGNISFDADSFADNDVVIGPVSSADIIRFSYSTAQKNTVVSPLDPRVEKNTESLSNLIQVPTPQHIQYMDLAKWLEEDYVEGDRVLMVTEKGARQTGIQTCIKEALDSSALAYNAFSYSILEGRDITEALTELMTLEGRNRFIIASESEAFVNDVIRNLNLLIYNNIDIVLYAPSKVRGFETIEVDNLHKTSMHVSLGYYIDYEDSKVKDFIKKYRALYNAEPNQFAFQGYDVARYFIETCTKYGNDWKDMIESNDMEMLQSTFALRKSQTGSYINNGVRRIIYDNGYMIRKVK